MPQKIAMEIFSQNFEKSPKLAEKLLKKQAEEKFRFLKKNFNSFRKI